MKKNEKQSLSTDEIFQKIEDGETPSTEDIAFVDSKQLKADLYNEIQEQGYSLNQIAKEAGLSPAHLSEFLSDKKKMSRDKLLAVFIILKYDISRLNRQLTRFGYQRLYSRNLRDFLLLTSIRDGLSLDEINDRLQKEQVDTL